MELLYKYRPFDSTRPQECQRTLEMLREGQIWMASPSSFNDPFDCKPSILRDKETEERDRATTLINYLRQIKQALKTGRQLANKQGQPIAHRTLVNLRRLLQSSQSDDKKYEALTKQLIVPPDAEVAFGRLQRTLGDVGVLSLSSTSVDMLMWAHYASQHSGFCLGFERSKGSLLADLSQTKAVNYFETYPELDLGKLNVTWSISLDERAIADSVEVDIQEPNLQTVIYSKAKDWEYEQEWRVLVCQGGRLSPYPGPLLKIIFGLRCERDSRQKIQEAVLAAAEGPVQFAEIQSVSGSFALRINDV